MNKQELRQYFKQKRIDLGAAQRESASTDIAKNFKQLVSGASKHVSIFLPIERLNEINTWHIINQVESFYYLPTVVGDDLKHIRYEGEEQLEVSDWGIPEPKYGEEVKPDLFDIVIIPLLAVDMNGNRVGYGKGFYDSFLDQCSEDCQFVGLSYFMPVETITDLRENDVPLHQLVTPEGLITF